MSTASVDPAVVDESAVGFRLAPRINAAGRLCRPEAALELLLADDEATAIRLARRARGGQPRAAAVEERIVREAVAQVESWPERAAVRAATSLADEGWHEGVIGIVASRLVERYGRPVVMIAGADGEWKGSGRSLPAVRPPRRLAACADHLERFGGHRAAAGLSMRPEAVDAFAEAFAAHAGADLTDEDLRPVTRIDAAVPGSALTLELAEELDGLRHSASATPVSRCSCRRRARGRADRRRRQARQVPGSRPRAARRQRDRLRVRRAARQPPRETTFDLAFRLQENRWNGTVSPQLVVRRILEGEPRYHELRSWLLEEWARRRRRLEPGGSGDLRRARARRERADEPLRIRDVSRAPRRRREPRASGLTAAPLRLRSAERARRARVDLCQEPDQLAERPATPAVLLKSFEQGLHVRRASDIPLGRRRRLHEPSREGKSAPTTLGAWPSSRPKSSISTSSRS